MTWLRHIKMNSKIIAIVRSNGCGLELGTACNQNTINGLGIFLELNLLVVLFCRNLSISSKSKFYWSMDSASRLL